MKSDADILRLILAEVEKPIWIDYGLCSTLFSLYSSGACNTEEFIRGNKLIESAISNTSIFNPRYRYYKKTFYYWKEGAKAPRIKWLKRQIKKLYETK